MTVPVMQSEFGGQHALTERIRELFVRVLDTEVPSAEVDLIDTGLLDSLALVSLILEIETEFGLSVSYDELEIDHFRTLESISRFVAVSQGASSASA